MFQPSNTHDPIDLGDLSSPPRYNTHASDTHYSIANSLNIGDDESTRGLRSSTKTDKSGTRLRVRTLDSGYDKRRWSPTNSASWSLERICVFISLASLLSLLGIFIRFQGRPLADWKFYFSLNTVASTLGTIGKSTLMLAVGAAIGQGKWQWFTDNPRPLIDFDTFDEASRGPLGSLDLMWTLRLKHFAVIGALVTVLSAASDPFLQAVVSYTGSLDDADRFVANSSLSSLKSSVARSERWAGLDSFAYIESTEDAPGDGNQYPLPIIRQDFSTNAAFYSGIVSSTTTSTASVNFGCWTGNCTSPVFTSAAICSQCKDITHLVKQVHVDMGTPEAVERSSENTGLEVGPLTNSTLPNTWTDNFNGSSQGYTSFMTAALTLDPKKTNVFQDEESLLGAFTIMRYTGVATECALYLCVNAYQSTVTNGTLNETVVNSWSKRVPESYAPLPSKDQPYAVQINNSAAVHSDTWTPPYQIGYLNRTDYQLSVPTNSTGLPLLGNTKVFSISQAAITTFQDFLSGMFTSKTGVNDTESIHELAYGYIANPLYTSSIMQPLLQSTNLTGTFDNIAKSMTNMIRNSGNAVTQQTTAQQWMLHIEIIWGFFVYPFATTVIGCFYALYTIQRTKRRGIPAWKTSVLASMAHGIHGDTRDTLKEMSLNGQRDLAKKSFVSLRERNGVVELRGQGDTLL